MVENILDRLEAFMKFKGLNNNQVTVKAGLSIGLLGKALKSKKGGLNSESIEKILHSFNDLNPEWLMLGNGKMVKGKQEFHYNDSEESILSVNETNEDLKRNKGSTLKEVCELCIEKDKRIASLERQLENLNQILLELTKGEQKRKTA